MNWSADDVVLVPLGVVTVTSTVPADSAGANAVIWPAPLTVNDVADAVPNVTAVAFVKLAPLIVTLVPPAVGPADGLTLDTVGGGGWTVAAPCATACAPP